MLTRWRFLATVSTAMLSAAALAGASAVPANAATPDAYLVLHASRGCYLYAPAHNVQVNVQCNTSVKRETWHDIRGAVFYDPVANTVRTAYELEITGGPTAMIGLCLNDDPANDDSVSADSCQPTGDDTNEYFWVAPTPIADTHWYRNVTASSLTGGKEYQYLTDLAGCVGAGAYTGDRVWDSPPGCGGYAEWTAVTS